MGARVYILSQTEYSNILGIFTNVRQCRKYISTLTNQENILLHEIRLNEPEKAKIDMTKLLTVKEVDLINMEKQRIAKETENTEEVKKVKVKKVKVKKVKVNKENVKKEKIENKNQSEKVKK